MGLAFFGFESIWSTGPEPKEQRIAGLAEILCSAPALPWPTPPPTLTLTLHSTPGFSPLQLLLGRVRLPVLLTLISPELEGPLPPELQPPFQQRYGLIRQQLTHGDFQLLIPAVPAAGPKVQHPAAVADPGLLWRKRRPVASATAHATSGAQPLWRCRSSVQPLQRWVRCSPWAISPWCRWQVSRGMQLGPG